MASTGRDATEATYSMQSKTLQEIAQSEPGRPLQKNVSLTMTNDHIDIPAKNVETFLSGSNLRALPTILGSAALHIDKKILQNIVNEVEATAELTFRVRHEGT
jgi:hypothetical protein